MYMSFIALMTLGYSGIPFAKYLMYGIPFFALLLWLASGKPRFNFNRVVAPFVFLLILSFISLVPWDYNAFKKTYFIFVFTSVFILFDFSKIEIDFRKLGLFFIALAIIWIFASGKGVKDVEYSVLDSKSALESTFAFPIGLIALYFIIVRKYILGFFFMACVMVFLKRIVLVAIILSIIVWFLPTKIRKVILNPKSVTIATLLITVFSIYFSYGYLDQHILDITGKAANDITKGRESLWHSALLSVNFSYEGFLLWGVGIGKVVTQLQQAFSMDRILLHNDLLSLVLEIGFVFFIVFVYLLNSAKTDEQRLIALFLTMLFSTDNVLIYQHLMFVYLLIQQDLSRFEVIKKPEIKEKVEQVGTRILRKRKSIKVVE